MYLHGDLLGNLAIVASVVLGQVFRCGCLGSLDGVVVLVDEGLFLLEEHGGLGPVRRDALWPDDGSRQLLPALKT